MADRAIHGLTPHVAAQSDGNQPEGGRPVDADHPFRYGLVPPPPTASSGGTGPATTRCSGSWCWPGGRADQQARRDPGTGRDLDRGAVVSQDQAALPVYATAGVASGAGGLKGFITNLDAPTPDYVLGAYHQLWQIEKSFRMSKSDLRARPIYHHKPDSIEAHLTIVMAALAVSRWLERVTGWSIKKLVQTLRRYRSIAVQAGDHILHAGTPLDDDVRAALNAVKTAATGH
jgi:hypothetical protein